MDTKESKTPEEEKKHVMGQRTPEDYEASEPQRQPEAKEPPKGLYRLLPVVMLLVLLAGVVFHYFGHW